MLPDTIKRIDKLIIKAEEATTISLKKYKHFGQLKLGNTRSIKECGIE
jgi:hypothetical protein